MEKKDSPAVVVTSAEKPAPKPVVVPKSAPQEKVEIKVPRQPYVRKTEDNNIANAIWNAIKDKPIDVFALPNQTVSDYFKPVTIEPSQLYLETNAPAAFPALETTLGSSYVVGRDMKFVIVKLPK
jgi:hypothetical protein